MKTEKNYQGNLLVWLDDGTEIIFSEHATEAIKTRPREVSLEDTILAILISVTTPSVIRESLRTDKFETYDPRDTNEPEELAVCDLEETVDELREVVEANTITQETVLKTNLMLSEEMLHMRRDMETINRKVDSLSSVVIGDGTEIKNSKGKSKKEKINKASRTY